MATGTGVRGRARWRRPAAWTAGGVLVLAGGGALVASAAEGGGAPAAQVHAWAIADRAPVLPLPLDAVAAEPEPEGPARDAAPAGDAQRDAAPTVAESEPDTLPSGAPTDAQVEAELRRALRTTGDRGGDARALVSAATLTPQGLATVPPDAPAKVAEIIRAGNQVARKPYVYGGGHGRLAGETWNDSAYDCSGSISFALAAAGMIDAPMTSGTLARWGRPGRGRWVTIYANAGHAFMTVAGLRFDTSGRAQTGSRWQTASRGTAGFTVVHPKGL